MASAVTRELRGDGYRVELDLSPQVLSLSIPEELTWQEGEEALAPSCRGVSSGFVSASMLALKAKLFDDGLYAAVELAAQRGVGRFPGKAALLAKLVRHAPELAAAASLGGMDVSLDPEALRIRDEFLANALAAKPLGFYTWNEDLQRIFQQDRLLQRPLDADRAADLAAALRADPAALAAYGGYLDLVSRLTNPLVPERPDLRRPDGCYFFPPSRAHETELLKRLFAAGQPIPEGFSIADEMVRRIRDGSLDLAPTADSGWYDWQTWALEPLVALEAMPEAARLRIDERYRQQLEELFKAVIALTRETHVKQLEIPELGCAMPPDEPERVVWVQPELTCEPLLTHYERRAAAYDFVRDVLAGALGADALKSIHRSSVLGETKRPLADELDEIRALFLGAAAVTGEELGIRAATGAAAARFRKWAAAPDPELDADVRMLVPVFHDLGRGKTKVWAVLGWATRELRVSFDRPLALRVLEGRVRIEHGTQTRAIAYPVFAEAYVSKLLDRDEFRAHCDRYKTRQQILAHL